MGVIKKKKSTCHRHCLSPLSSEHGTCKTVRARFCSDKCPEHRLSCCRLTRCSRPASQGGGVRVRCRANMAHARQSRPDSDLGFQVKVLRPFEMVPSRGSSTSRRNTRCSRSTCVAEAREFFIDNLLVRIHCIIVMIRRTGLAPWEFENPLFQVALYLPF